MSPVEHYSTHSAGMQFAHVPALRPLKANNTPRHMLTIHREYTSDFDTHFPSTALMKSSDEENGLSE